MKVVIDGVEYIPAPKIEDVGNAHIDALNLRIETDIGAVTIREYLYALLKKLWVHGESFNSKRPFGNSGWQNPLEKPLIEAGFVTLSFMTIWTTSCRKLEKPLIEAGFVTGDLYTDSDGSIYVNSISRSEFNEFTEKMIYAVFLGKPSE